MTRLCVVEGCEKPSPKASLCSMHMARKRRHGSVHAVKVIWGDPLAAFLQKVDKTGNCWEWTASKNAKTGYGQFNSGRKSPTTAHRAAWELLVGEIPAGMHIDHICHNRGCVNPAHLRIATPKQNLENFTGLKSNNTTGIRGLRMLRSGKWFGKVQSFGVTRETPRFDTKQEAEAATIALRNELHTHNDLDRINQQERAS